MLIGFPNDETLSLILHSHLVDLVMVKTHPVIPEQMNKVMPVNQLFANTCVIQNRFIKRYQTYKCRNGTMLMIYHICSKHFLKVGPVMHTFA